MRFSEGAIEPPSGNKILVHAGKPYFKDKPVYVDLLVYVANGPPLVTVGTRIPILIFLIDLKHGQWIQFTEYALITNGPLPYRPHF